MRGLHILLAAAWLVAGCAETPPPPPPAVPAPALPEPPPPKAALPRLLSAKWAFKADEESCVASAINPGMMLQVSATHSGVRMVVRTPRGAPAGGAGRQALRFQGAAGAWTVQGYGAKLRNSGAHIVEVAGQMDEDGVGRILVLLSGGTLRVAAGWPTLAIPAAGSAGKAWFECVRRQLKT